MGLSTPLKRIPGSDDMHLSIAFIDAHNTDLRSRHIVYDLRSTIVADLWPDGVVPHTKEGQLWKVANEHDFKFWKQKNIMYRLMKIMRMKKNKKGG